MLYHDFELIICRDPYLALDNSDNININNFNTFKKSEEYISEILNIHSLVDLRIFTSEKCMPTWRHNNKASRLDYAFMSMQIFNYIEKYNHDWSFKSKLIKVS